MAAQAKFEDSNIALLNSDLAIQVRQAAAETEEMWKGAGQAPGIQIWRIEKLAINHWPKDSYGSFYSGDSYIVLHTYKEGDSDKLLHNVHFWLGQETSQDEAGVAAYKTVELDDLLGQLPVQFREVQGFETEEFLSLFPTGVQILEGGIESGFNKVKPEEYKPRLLHVKGSKNIRVSQVPLARDSLNEGDVFILDNGLELVQWNGDHSAIKEKRKALEVVNRIKEERLGKPRSSVLDGDEDHENFWDLLGGKGPVKSAEEGGCDHKVESFTKSMHRVSDASGSLVMTKIASGKLTKADLDDKDVFIVDTSTTVFVYIGSEASKDEKANAFKFANDYLVQSGRPFTTSVIRVVQGTHNKAFEAAFY